MFNVAVLRQHISYQTVIREQVRRFLLTVLPKFRSLDVHSQRWVYDKMEHIPNT